MIIQIIIIDKTAMDTIVIIRDSVAMCAKEMHAICSPCVKEAETNWQDVFIVFIICLTLLIIALNGICNYFKWKKYEKVASADAAKEKRKNDVEDRQWKLSVDKDAHDLKRKEDEEDHDKKLEEKQVDFDKEQKVEQEKRNKKQRSDLQDKLLIFYEDRLIKDKKDDKGNVIVYDEDNCKEYVEQLKNMINELK